MYQGKNVKVHVELVKPGMMGSFKTEKVKEILESFMKSKNVLKYTITHTFDDVVLITITYED